MAKIYLSELSAVLAEKHGIDRRTAQRFVTSVVAVVQNGLDADRMVKIKGLGTFKIIDVEARESVNVNTGERLVIDSHSKLTFLPDNAMKELVNRPFSQFETVVLNEGVDFGDEAEREPAVIEVEEEAPANVETAEEYVVIESADDELVVSVAEEQEAEKEESFADEVQDAVVEQEEEVLEAVQAVADQAEESIVETEETKPALPNGWTLSEDPATDSDTEQMSIDKKHNWVIYAIIALIALLLGGVAGYLIGRSIGENVSAHTEMTKPQVTQEVTSDQQPQNIEEQTVAEEEQPAEPQVEEDNDIPIWEKYNEMDPRTRNGYYFITGLDRIEKAKAGDTTSRISRRVFGAAELACYIEVFNGIDGRTVLEEGTEVKIPKIESKKSVKKRLQQQNNQQ